MGQLRWVETPFTVHNADSIKPSLNKEVIVCGGVASWNGTEWISHTDGKRPIQWKVEWWMNFPDDTDFDDLVENSKIFQGEYGPL